MCRCRRQIRRDLNVPDRCATPPVSCPSPRSAWQASPAIFHLHGVCLAEFPGLHHRAGLPHKRVAGVVMRDGEDDAGSFADLRQLFGLRRST